MTQPRPGGCVVRAFGSEKASGRWITGGKIGRGLVCTTHHATATTAVWEPLEHSNCVVTDHVDIDVFWMAP